MKNSISYCIFIVALFINLQGAIAQDQQAMPEAIAKEKTHAIYQQLELDGTQQGLVWKAFLAQELAYREQLNKQNLSAVEVAESRKRIDAEFIATMKKSLSEAQFKKFIALREKQ